MCTKTLNFDLEGYDHILFSKVNYVGAHVKTNPNKLCF